MNSQTPTTRCLSSIKSPSGEFSLTATNYGARVISLCVPQFDNDSAADKSKYKLDVIVGFSKPDDFFQGDPYFGAIIGRVANRTRMRARCEEESIAERKFPAIKINETSLGNHLHGGVSGFSDKIWEMQKVNDSVL